MSLPTAVADRDIATPVSAAHHSTFRPDIEGMRAISVIAVVIFHAFPKHLPGGFIGVDVFFVISGFLITQLLLREIETTGSFSLAEFWARRIRRILPAATLVLCAVAALALVVPGIDPRIVGRQITAAALFYFNWRQAAQGVDYLAADERDNPVLHYWSLSVEEQFYLVWPLILAAGVWLMARRAQWRITTWLPLIALPILALSFVLCLETMSASRSLAFFSTFTRGWQLLAGALVTVALMRLPAPKPIVANILGLGAIGLLAAGFVGITESVPYPGYAALVPTVAAALLIYSGAYWSATRPAPVRSALSVAPLKYIGRISFSWYLWHWPLLAFVWLAYDAASLSTWAAIAVSFLLAAATYRFIECPLRFSKRLQGSRRLTYAFGACLLVAGIGTGLGMRFLAPDKVHIGNGVMMSREAIKRDRPAIYSDRCLLRFDDIAYDACAYGDTGGARTVVLFGDSHAGNWFTPLDLAAQQQGWKLLVRIKASCSPVDVPMQRTDGTPYSECATWRENVLAELAASKPQLIIVGSASNGYPVAREAAILDRLAAIAPIVVMRDTPVLPEAPDRCLDRVADPAECAWPMDGLMQPRTYPQVAADALPKNARVVDLNDRICPEGLCRAVLDGRPVTFDPHHLSATFSATLTDAFDALLAEAAGQRE